MIVDQEHPRTLTPFCPQFYHFLRLACDLERFPRFHCAVETAWPLQGQRKRNDATVVSTSVFQVKLSDIFGSFFDGRSIKTMKGITRRYIDLIIFRACTIMHLEIMFTLLKFNIALKNRPSQKSSLPTIFFRSGGGTPWPGGLW